MHHISTKVAEVNLGTARFDAPYTQRGFHAARQKYKALAEKGIVAKSPSQEGAGKKSKVLP